MSFSADLRRELAGRGIRGRLARRIELELDDHRRCDPSAALGNPRLIAERFAEELRVPRTRKATLAGFGALALTAVLLGVPAQAVSSPDTSGARGLIVALGGLGIALAGQVALVSGVLALWRGFRPAAAPGDLRLVQQRLAVALGAGGAVLVGEAVQAVAMRPVLSSWSLALAATAVLVPTGALGAAAGRLRGASAMTPLVNAVPRAFPAALVVAIGAGAVLTIGIGSTFTERSASEGLARGVLEAVAFVGCFALLGRRLGIRR